MIDVAELIAGWIYAVRITTPGQWLLRVVMLVAGGVGAVVVADWVPEAIRGPWLAVTLGLLLATLMLPDSVVPLLAMGMTVAGWAMGGAGAPWWVQLLVAALTALFHVTAAQAATAPSYSAITRRAGGRMAAVAAGFVGVSTAAAAVALGATLIPDGVLPRGLWWVVLASLGTAAGAVAIAGRLGRADRPVDD